MYWDPEGFYKTAVRITAFVGFLNNLHPYSPVDPCNVFSISTHLELNIENPKSYFLSGLPGPVTVSLSSVVMCF